MEKMPARPDDVMEIRPYQLLCLVCRLGRQNHEPYYFEEKLDELQKRIAANPYCVLKLRCDVESTFRFQNPGDADDTPEGKSFNRRRDLTVLQRLGLLPGAEVPACDLLRHLTRPNVGIAAVQDICCFEHVTAPAWQGCRHGGSGNYERGLAKAIAVLMPGRDLATREACKKTTAEAMYQRRVLQIRPHHLLCMACFTANCRPGDNAPILEDNLYEAVETCRRDPSVIIELVPGPCMICPPCGGYDPDSGLCSMACGMGLRDQKKDLDTLQLLGLDYGAKVPAGQLYQLVFARIPDVKAVCAFKTNRQTHEAWSICGSSQTPPDKNRYRLAAADNLGLPRT